MPDHRKVAIFWDYENCSPPLSSQGCAIVNGIRRIANIFGCVTTFKTYLDLSSQSSKNSVVFRSELQSSGVSITDCPHNGKKDVVDKMILVDMLAFAIDHQSPATVILIAGDRDYAYALSTLRLRQYSVILIVPSGKNIPQTLQSQASVVLDWNYAILGKRPDADTPPFRKPCSDLDDDIVERLAREIRDSIEDPAVTLLSSSHPSSTAPAHSRSVSAADVLEPSVFQRNTDSSDAVRPAPTCTPKKAAVSVLPETPGHSRVGSGVSHARSTTQSTFTVPDIDLGSGSPFTGNDALSDECVSTTNGIQDAPHDPFARPSSASPRLERYQNIAEPGSTPIANFRCFSPSPAPSNTYNLDSRTTPLLSLSHSRTISGGTPVSYGNPSQRSAPTAIPSSPVSTSGRSDIAAAPKSRLTDSVSAIMDDSMLPSDRAAVMAALGLDDEDEVDDHPHTAMNTVEPRLNEGRASFDNSAPANDTSPPLTEPYGSPTSEESSLISSISDSSITMPNVETGPPQATPVISDNSNNHSSMYQAPPTMESVEDKIRRLTPPQFMPLINQLLIERSKGMDKASRSMIAFALLQYDKDNDIFKRAGATGFAEYASRAERAFLIARGGRGSEAWISLHPKLVKGGTTPSPTSSVHSNSSSAPPQHNIETPPPFATTTPPPNIASQAPPIIESIEDKIRRLTPPQFLPLINRLLMAKSKGMDKASKSMIAFALLQYDKDNDIFKRAGANGCGDYISRAERAFLIVRGGRESQAWISLNPKLFKEDSTSESPTPSSSSSSIRTPPPNLASPAATPNPSTLPPPPATRPPNFVSPAATPNSCTPLPPPAVSDEPMPFYFSPLTTLLAKVQKGGMTRPRRSSVDLILGPAVYAAAGVSTLKQYLDLAAQAGIVELGGVGGDAWVMLHPNFASPAATPNSSTPPSPPAVSDEPIPFYFSPLTSLLVKVQKGGMTKPRHSSVDLILGPAVYATAGVSTLKEYLNLAVQAGIVELGGVGSDAWVMLHPNFTLRTATPNPITPPTPSAIRTSPPNFASRVATPNPITPPPPPPAVSEEPMPFSFYPLITLLVKVQKGGMTKTRRSTVDLILGPAAYATAGVSTLKEYLDLAVQAEIVELGVDEHEWVMLHPDVFSGKRSF